MEIFFQRSKSHCQQLFFVRSIEHLRGPRPTTREILTSGAGGMLLGGLAVLGEGVLGRRGEAALVVARSWAPMRVAPRARVRWASMVVGGFVSIARRAGRLL